MYCSRCGTLLQFEASACPNCGAPLDETPGLVDGLEDGNVSKPQPVARNSRIALWLGFLAVLPYLCALSASVYYELFPSTPQTYLQTRQVTRYIFYPMFLGILSGIPFGVAAIVTGTLGYRRQPENRRNGIAALSANLLGLAGISGHLYYIWFVATCQMCQ